MHGSNRKMLVLNEKFATLPRDRDFAQDQCVRLGTPGWSVLDFYGSLLNPDELERQKGNFKKGPLVLCDCEQPLRKTWSLKGLVLLTHKCQFSQKCLASWMHRRWEAAMNCSRSCERSWFGLPGESTLK